MNEAPNGVLEQQEMLSLNEQNHHEIDSTEDGGFRAVEITRH
jgi:hypothetical protein